MTNLILLDPVGDAPPPDGYIVIENEVDFLRHAPDELTLLIRGLHLCDWARSFYPGRQIGMQETHSPLREIQEALPDLTDAHTLELYHLFGADRFAIMDRPLNPQNMVATLYPGRLWHDQPTRQHAAEWLLWLYENDPSPAVQTVLDSITQQWQQTASGPEAKAYTVTSKKTAQGIVEAWLQIRSSTTVERWCEFPVAVPADLQRLAAEEWRKEIITSRGEFFSTVPMLPIPNSLKDIATQETFRHLQKKPEQLTHSIYAALEPYLSQTQQAELGQHLPPNPPGSLPAHPAAVVDWFKKDYLPFRRWQSRYGDTAATQQADDAAREFALWYVDHYPAGLMGGPLRDHLSFRQLVEQTNRSDDVVTLVAVLDGLHVDDAKQLVHALHSKTSRLTALQDHCVFAPLPTVTVFTKEALLKGVPPSRVDEVGYLGKVLPERTDPTDHLENLVLGDVIIWRVMEPDMTYHGRNAYDSLLRDVESALLNVAQKLADIVDRVSPALPLRIILATDHGRLLAEASRMVPIPKDMESHGRAAWGSLRSPFGKAGYVIEGDLAHLHGEHFGLPSDIGEAAVMLGSAMFYTNDAKRGSEKFPHGGLYPEEVIVPWIEFARDWVIPEIEITIKGSGAAGRREQASVHLVNVCEIPLTLQSLRVRLARKDVDVLPGPAIVVPPQSPADFMITLDPWPTGAELDTMTARVTFALPTGKTFESTVSLSLESKELYQRDNILEDLD